MTVKVKQRAPNTPALIKVKSAIAKKQKDVVPEYLIYEVIDGNPVYYRGYEQVLNGTTEFEAIMGSSILQSLLISDLLAALFQIFSRSEYLIGTNELGVLYKKGSWVSTDIAVIRQETLKNYTLNNEYLKLPPALVIEIDTKADFENFNSVPDYYNTKTQRLLDFGVENVIWLFTSSEKVMIAKRNQDWITSDWNKTVDLIDGKSLDLKEILIKLKR